MSFASRKLGFVFAAMAFCNAAQAGVFFDFICDDPTCNGSPDLSLTIEFDSTVVVPNGSFTGADNGILSMTWSSGVGDGFTLTLADLVDNGGADNDRSDLRITFDPTASIVKGLEDINGSIISPGFLGSIGEIQFREGANFDYFIDDIDDYSPANVSDNRTINGLFVRRVPTPATLFLLAIGLAGIAGLKNRKTNCTV
ncbi:MAG: PEP-CTERM sorting domain-containing protein [Chromatiaceae bacterium]|nr:PEP-CTERM sorting domain-containing protein [Chromatiaceae bacterium]